MQRLRWKALAGMIVGACLVLALPLLAQAKEKKHASGHESTETAVDLSSLDQESSPVGSGAGGSSDALQIHGFAVGDYSTDLSSGANSFDASALALAVFKPLLRGRVSLYGQLTAARDAGPQFVAPGQSPSSLPGPADIATDIDTLQVNWVVSPEHGFDMTFGKFDSPLAVERDDAPLNYQATSSYLFDFGRPVKFTGLMLHEAFSPELEGYAIIANGNDGGVDNNQQKTGALYGIWSPSLAQHYGLGVIRGREGGSARATTVATLTLQPAASWVVGGEGISGRQAASPTVPVSARWKGVMLFLHHRFPLIGEEPGQWALTARGEIFDDPQGIRTGIAQRLTSLTLSPQYLVGGGFYGIFHNLEHTTLRLPELAVRLDLRWDHSTVPVFAQGADTVGSNHWSSALQVVYVF
ncbi:MAG TPA: outer membrane beta-barrel protein [Thermoanaerobaculia bacterium]|nr:outer membrane beta-barrel protein [Thermoanaerobaculia bacterium]